MKEFTQSQDGGHKFEKIIQEKVFNLEYKNNNTDKYDISKLKNKFNDKENISIKSTNGSTIYCGDILRFFNYKFDENTINTIVVIKYKQDQSHKIVQTIYEINYNKELHRLLFGTITYKILEEYVNNVKQIPTKTKGKEAKKIFDYLKSKQEIQKKYNMKAIINPKVDSSQTRVQISIPHFDILCEKYIIKKSTNQLRNVIIPNINSEKRNRKNNKDKNTNKNKDKDNITKTKLIEICRNNKDKCKRYSKMKKSEIIILLNELNIPIN